MKQILLIASDLDGTLLRNDKTLSPFTRKVLARCREKGILFVAATARPPRALEGWIDGLCCDGAICHNGGVATLDGKIIWEQGIAPEKAAKTIKRIQKEFPEARISAEAGGDLFANFDVSPLWPGIEFKTTDFSTFPNIPAEKLIVELKSPSMSEKITELLPDGLTAQVSENAIIMIQPEGVEKGAALKGLCERLHIPLSKTVAFGDDWNDISLLRTAGTGVAVGNALPEVKAAADEICADNEDDGPARWLEAHAG